MLTLFATPHSHHFNASLCYMMEFKERILRPDLCGGALLDLGVYSINFCSMYFGADVINETSNCIKGNTGMDMHNSISWSYSDGRIANIQSSALCLCGRIGQICGTEGYLLVDNINCPQSITVYNDYMTNKNFLNQIIVMLYRLEPSSCFAHNNPFLASCF